MFKFLGILCFLLFFASLLVSINPKWVARGKEPLKRKHTLLTALVMFVLFFVFLINSDSTDTKPSISPTPPASASVSKPAEPTPTPFDFTNAELTKENIIKAIAKIVPEKQITDVTVEQKDGKNIVNVSYKPDSNWSESTFVQGCSNKATDTMEVMFSNAKVDKVWFWGQTEMVDPKGNSSIENGFNVSMTKENAKDINWKNFKDLVMSDYKNLKKVADSMFIAPGIAKNLK